MHHELEPLVQRSNQELPAPADVRYLAAHQQAGVVELAWNGRMRVPPHIDGTAPGQLWIQLPANGFHLWKLGHRSRLFGVSSSELRSGPPRKPDAGADAFFDLDLRAGRVIHVEPFPEARKSSYKLTVDFAEPVGVLNTSAQVTNYSQEELRGRMVVGAINLGSRRIAGFESQFLLLGTIQPDGIVRLLQVEDGVQPGAPVA